MKGFKIIFLLMIPGFSSAQSIPQFEIEGKGFINNGGNIGISVKDCGSALLVSNSWAGFIASDSKTGVFVYRNNIGINATNNENNGIVSSWNDGYAAHLTSPTTCSGAAVHISLDNDADIDLEFGGDARITSEEHIYMDLDKDNTSTAGKLYVRRNDASVIAVFSEMGNIEFRGHVRMRDNSGDQKIVLNHLDGKGDFTGRVCAPDFVACSDIRYKKNITPITSGLSNLSLINQRILPKLQLYIAL